MIKALDKRIRITQSHPEAMSKADRQTDSRLVVSGSVKEGLGLGYVIQCIMYGYPIRVSSVQTVGKAGIHGE